METMSDFNLTNELLEKVLGGVSTKSNKIVYSFTGPYADIQAKQISQPLEPACSCSCAGGSGAGAGSH